MRKGLSIVVVLLMVINLLLIGVLCLSVKKLRDNQAQIQAMYTEEQVNNIKIESINAGLNEGLVQGNKEGKNGLLDYIRTLLTIDKKSAIATFKLLFPNDIVAVSNGSYHIIPISDDIPHNNYETANLAIHYTDETEEKVSYMEYIENGNKTSHKGIDVSVYQGNIDWQKAKADGVEFAIIRVMYRSYSTGKLTEDTKWEANVKGAQAAGIKTGVYGVTQAISTAEAIEEAQYLLKLTSKYKFELPYVMDIERVSSKNWRAEDLSQEDRTAFALAFMDTIKAAGKEAMIYHNTEMGAVLLDISQICGKYPTWFANYATEMYWPYDYSIWQYSATGKVKGINGDVDLNIWIGDLP